MLQFLPLLGALRSLIDGAASVMKAVNDSKAARRQLEERHDRAIKQGRGLYLSSYKCGQSIAAKKKKRQRDDKNALGCNYQLDARETYAHTVL